MSNLSLFQWQRDFSRDYKVTSRCIDRACKDSDGERAANALCHTWQVYVTLRERGLSHDAAIKSAITIAIKRARRGERFDDGSRRKDILDRAESLTIAHNLIAAPSTDNLDDNQPPTLNELFDMLPAKLRGIANLLAMGLSQVKIANRLHTSTATISRRVDEIRRHLAVFAS